jgi:hypothetical protein
MRTAAMRSIPDAAIPNLEPPCERPAEGASLRTIPMPDEADHVMRERGDALSKLP